MTENKKFYIQTFGCQMNEHDSETLAGMLCDKGYTENEDRDSSDIIVMNTCSVRENADKRFFGTLGQIKKIKEKNPSLIVAVCGCMMQQQHIVDTLKAKYSWVDIVFGTHNIHEFPSLLNNCINEKKKIISLYEDREEIVEGLTAKRKFRHKSFVNIMYGCNNFCTYCIVPYTRGREKSRHPEEILSEIRSLVDDGVKEVTLLGQNVNSYGAGSEFGTDFPGLIRKINEIDGLGRIRFMTSHPKDLSEDLIRVFSECEKLCSHIHLPVQAGSDRVLKRMNRKYTRDQYMELVGKLRDAVPDIAITTDIIVGFPGESEADFEDTLDLVRRIRYDSAFTFLYSVRKGTPAEKYANQIPEAEKHRRFNILVDVMNSITAEKNKEYEGREEIVLFDGKSKIDKHGKPSYSGRTGTFKLVNIMSDIDCSGEFFLTKITKSNTFSLEGVPIFPKY